MTPTSPTTHASPQRPGGGTAVAPRHACVRCGAAIDLERSLCEECNPLGLSQPATSQVHGTALAGVAIGVIALFVLARLSLSGIGPFEGRVGDVRTQGVGLAITLVVENAGSNPGQATCRISDPAARYGGASAYVLSPRIPAGETVVFEAEIRQLGTAARPLIVECSGP